MSLQATNLGSLRAVFAASVAQASPISGSSRAQASMASRLKSLVSCERSNSRDPCHLTPLCATSWPLACISLASSGHISVRGCSGRRSGSHDGGGPSLSTFSSAASRTLHRRPPHHRKHWPPLPKVARLRTARTMPEPATRAQVLLHLPSQPTPARIARVGRPRDVEAPQMVRRATHWRKAVRLPGARRSTARGTIPKLNALTTSGSMRVLRR
mmetsp:Transcript_108175/g.304731  ORF Transcript_108175/g.304731 Transcript_108175/m.304731 type:complete len:213 (+) Transcript_108175:1733-2371(+)